MVRPDDESLFLDEFSGRSQLGGGVVARGYQSRYSGG